MSVEKQIQIGHGIVLHEMIDNLPVISQIDIAILINDQKSHD